MSGIGGIKGPSRVPGQNGFNNQQDFKAEWSVLKIQPNKEVGITATAVRPIPPNLGTMATITVFQELGTSKKIVSPPFKAPIINGRVSVKWVANTIGNLHFEVRIGGLYGRTDARLGALNVGNQNSPMSNYYKDSFQR